MSFTQTLTRCSLLLLITINGAIFLSPLSYALSASFPKSDSLLTAQIEAQIAANQALAKLPIQVTVTNSSVSISGTLPTKKQAMALISLTGSITGIQSIDVTGLSLEKGKLSSDALIKSQVIGILNREGLMGPLSQAPIVVNLTGPASITYSTPPPPINIQVQTKDGVVFLSGFAPSQDKVDQAIDLAKSIPGVSDVQSSIIVGP